MSSWKTLKGERSKEDRAFDRATEKASLYNIIRSKIFEQRKDSRFKDDYGQTNEVLQEHNRKVGTRHTHDGCFSVPETALQYRVDATVPTQYKKRTDITSATGSGASLISEIVRPDLYIEKLYAQTWMARAGVPTVTNLQGDVKIPRTETAPAFSWIAENGTFPDQNQDFDDVKMTPLFAGGIQVLSLGIFLRSQNNTVINFVQRELMRSFQSGIEKSFLQDDGTNHKPKGLYKIISDHSTNEVSALPTTSPPANKGGPISYAKCLEVEQKITSTNQDMPLTWLVSDRVRIKALQVLKFNVNGASQLFMPGSNMLADRPAIVTNSIRDDIVRGTGKTSKIVLFQPQSLVLGRWLGGIQLQVSTDAPYWNKSATGIKILDVCNIVSRRDTDFAALKELESDA